LPWKKTGMGYRSTSATFLLYQLQYLRQKIAKIERLSTIRFLPTKVKSVKETTAHARDNKRFTMFKPMP
jgi:hypothetical protein